MTNENDVVSFDFILDCWKKKSYPDGFEDVLEKYVLNKADVFSDVRVDQPTKWLGQTLTAIEIGISINAERFLPYKKYWEKLLAREWVVDIDTSWIRWKV